GIFNVLAVKAPGFGDRRKEMLQDIAIVTGAQFVSEELGKKLDGVDISELGHAHRVASNKDNTTIVGAKGDKKEIENRIAEIKNQIKKTESDFDKEKLQERLGKLAGGVAVIKVGAPTESAQKELKQRVEDAVAATRAAMEEGIVPGGGIALYNASMSFRSAATKEEDIIKATNSIILRALTAPIQSIVSNSGEHWGKIESDLAKRKIPADQWLGFDAAKNKIVDLKSAGVIDPLKVTKTAFINALSVAANYLTVGAAVVNIPENPPAGGVNPPMNPMMGGEY
ncbi:MAG: chaperonin GroEL, partial [Patescibacteria group bacterium]|nr:chaperonin GroEL [Patescibacteria group bacterium]